MKSILILDPHTGRGRRTIGDTTTEVSGGSTPENVETRLATANEVSAAATFAEEAAEVEIAVDETTQENVVRVIADKKTHELRYKSEDEAEAFTDFLHHQLNELEAA